MKKFIVFLISVISIFGLCSCSGSKEEDEKGQLCGGWTEQQDGEISPSLLEIFNLAFKNNTEYELQPQKLLATQVVAGVNYKFLCLGKKLSEGNQKQFECVVYKNLKNECFILSINPVE